MREAARDGFDLQAATSFDAHERVSERLALRCS